VDCTNPCIASLIFLALDIVIGPSGTCKGSLRLGPPWFPSSHVCLLSTRNVAFAKLLSQIIRLWAQFPDYPIKKIRLNNAGEFTSQAFDNYCMSIRIDVEYPVTHTHTQNGLAESFIKRLQMIARPLLMKTKLPIFAWGHAILHAALLVRIRPTAYHKYSPLQLVFGQQPNIFHFRIFGCAVYVSISPPQRTKMGPQRKLGIYVGFDSPSIIKYLEPLTSDIFKVRFDDCHFNETIFPPFRGEKSLPEARREITWNVSTLFHLDPCINQSELEVQRIIHLQGIANQLPDVFTDSKKIVKSHILTANNPARIEVPKGQLINIAANESKTRLKRGRLVGAKDKISRKRKTQEKQVAAPEEAIPMKQATSIINLSKNCAHKSPENEPPEKGTPEKLSPKKEQIPENDEISIYYVSTGEIWDRNKIVVDNIFLFKVALDITRSNDHEIEPQTVEQCRRRND
jgi:hypothetical protein